MLQASSKTQTPLAPAASDLKYQTMQFFNSPKGRTAGIPDVLANHKVASAFRPGQRTRSVVHNQPGTPNTVVETLASLNVQAKNKEIKQTSQIATTPGYLKSQSKHRTSSSRFASTASFGGDTFGISVGMG